MTGILIAHLGVFGSGELKIRQVFCKAMVLVYFSKMRQKRDLKKFKGA